MIKLTATAPIYSISQVIQVSERFQKRELVLNDSWEKDGTLHESYVVIEFSGDKMAQLDQFVPGQRVTAEAIVSGREYNGRYYNSIKGMTVTPYQPQQNNSYQQAPPPSAYPQQATYPTPPGSYPNQGAYPTPGGYPPSGGYPQQQAGYQQNRPAGPMPTAPQGGNLGPDGLPFR